MYRLDVLQSSSCMKPKLKHILREKGNEFIKTYGEEFSPYVISVILAVINCCTNRNGYRSFFCYDCKRIRRIPFTCKKRLCPSCSQWANHHFAINFVQRMLPVTHRHITYGIPGDLWKMFHNNPKYRKLLIKAAYKTVQQAMRTYLPVDDIIPGALCVLHNFGRDLKKNCHIHMIVSEGGMWLGEWYKFTYFPFEKKGRIHTTINQMWRDNVLDILRIELPRTKKNARFLAGFKKRYPNGFYVYGGKDCRIKCNKSAYNRAKYITRYTRHPPISDKRISSYDGDEVTFWWDHPSTNVRHYVTLPVMEFIYRVVIHLPEPGFKMVVPYGLYAPKYVNKPTVQAIFTISGKVVDPKKLTWRESIMIFTGQDPLACKYCREEMILVCIVYQWKRRLKVKYFLDNYDLSAIEYPDEISFARKLG